MYIIINLSFTKTEASFFFLETGIQSSFNTELFYLVAIYIITTFISYRIPDMDRRKQTSPYEFLLMGLSEQPE